MTKQFLCGCIASLLFLNATGGMAADTSLQKAFTVAEPGMKRFVITLPHITRDEEANFKVQLRVGKEMETDGVNLYQLGGQLEAQPLKGWGYTYYEYKGSPVVASTLMGVPADTPTRVQFVSTKALLINYNSRIPVVVYVPEQLNVEYRIWTAADRYLQAEPG